MNNLHVKTGDNVMVISGKDKGKTGKVLQTSPKEGKVIVIRPDSTEGFSRLERDKEKILNMYDEGYAKGIDISGKVAEFFAK